MQKIVYLKITDKEWKLHSAGLVVFLKQNLIDCASSVHVGFILACVYAYVHFFF